MIEIIENSFLRAWISRKGAELLSLRTASGTELMWQADPAWWGHCAPILFPIIGRSSTESPILAGAGDPMPQHGFARESLFAVERKDDQQLVLILTETAQTRSMFPHAFRLEVQFRLSRSELLVSAEVTNPSDTAMPFCLGFHPGFACDTRSGAATLELSDWEAEIVLRVVDGNLLDGFAAAPFEHRKLALTPATFSDGAIVITNVRSQEVKLRQPGMLLVCVSFDTPNLGLWSRPGAQFVCIEPWAGLPHDATHQCLMLARQDRAHFTMSIKAGNPHVPEVLPLPGGTD